MRGPHLRERSSSSQIIFRIPQNKTLTLTLATLDQPRTLQCKLYSSRRPATGGEGCSLRSTQDLGNPLM
jgi:hypothetical protein